MTYTRFVCRPHELRTILTKCGKDRMTGKEADELIAHLLDKYDTNRDGKFSYPGQCSTSCSL